MVITGKDVEFYCKVWFAIILHFYVVYFQINISVDKLQMKRSIVEKREFVAW